jgi:hypothetical protein
MVLYSYQKDTIMNFKPTEKMIFDGGHYSEDFIVVKKDNEYIAFYTKGSEQYQQLYSARSSTPDGEFISISTCPLHTSKMRLGSIIPPCEHTNNKWRLYYNKLFNYDNRTIAYIESMDLNIWENETLIDMEIPIKKDLFGRKDAIIVQPCCRIVNGVFFLIVNKAIRTPDRSIDTSVIDSYISVDGIHFYPYKTPLISPIPGTLLSKKIGNPYFIFDEGKINIFAEGNDGPGWHLFNFILHNDNITCNNTPLINSNEILANPSIEKFNDIYYLYYGKYIKDSYKIFVAIGNPTQEQKK